MIVEFLEVTFSRYDTCKLLYDTSLALARSSPTRRYTGFLRILLTKLTKLTGMFWRDSGAIHCSIYKRCIAATIARIWIPNLGHLRSVDMSDYK